MQGPSWPPSGTPTWLAWLSGGHSQANPQLTFPRLQNPCLGPPLPRPARSLGRQPAPATCCDHQWAPQESLGKTVPSQEGGRASQQDLIHASLLNLRLLQGPDRRKAVEAVAVLHSLNTVVAHQDGAHQGVQSMALSYMVALPRPPFSSLCEGDGERARFCRGWAHQPRHMWAQSGHKATLFCRLEGRRRERERGQFRVTPSLSCFCFF